MHMQQYFPVLSLTLGLLSEEILEILHSTMSIVLANQENLFRIAHTAIYQDTVLEDAPFKLK